MTTTLNTTRPRVISALRSALTALEKAESTEGKTQEAMDLLGGLMLASAGDAVAAHMDILAGLAKDIHDEKAAA